MLEWEGALSVSVSFHGFFIIKEVGGEMEPPSPLAPHRYALRSIFQSHCEGTGTVMSLKELLRFCSNVGVFPVRITQELASSQEINHFAGKCCGRQEEIRLSYTQFERFLSLLAGYCYPLTVQSPLFQLLSHMQGGLMRVYRISLLPSSDSSSISLRGGSFLDFSQAVEMRGEPQTCKNGKQLLKMKSVPRLTKKLSLTTLSFTKAVKLKQIYSEHVKPAPRKTTPGNGGTPKAKSMRVSLQAGEENGGASPAGMKTSIRPFFSRVQSRHGSVSRDILTRIKASFDTFKAQVHPLLTQPRPKPRATVTFTFLRKLHSRRVAPVRCYTAGFTLDGVPDLETEGDTEQGGGVIG